MKITMQGMDFNRIMRVCVPALSNDNTRKPLMYIKIESNGKGEGCATALDGFVLAQTRFLCEGDAGECLLFPLKPVDEHSVVEISSDNELTSVQTEDCTITRKVPPVGGYIIHSKVTQEAQKNDKVITVALNPVHLARILKSHKRRNEPVFLDIYADTKPIVVSTDESMGLLLPIRFSFNRETPGFWAVNADGD